MNEKEYASGQAFVANVLSTGIEKLPQYKILPPEKEAIDSSEQGSEKPASVKQAAKKENASQKGVKRTCGHSHKSVRMEHKQTTKKALSL
jgi:hypothetical protein